MSSEAPGGEQSLADIDPDERRREQLAEIEDDLRLIADTDLPFAQDAQAMLDELEALRR